jgi:membrane associated rhomboid family serine protease
MLDDFKNAFSRYNNATIQLIIINVIVFVVLGAVMVIGDLAQLSVLKEIPSRFNIPAPIQHFVRQPWSIVTYAFMHGGLGHIFFNMLALYYFGRLFAEYLGSDKLIAVYVLGAIAGGVLYLLAYNTIPYFVAINAVGDHPVTMVGASAAVDAIIVATATLLPDYTFFLFLLGPVRIKYIAAFLVATSFLSATGANAGGNIAHLGGAFIGFVYMKQLQAGSNWGAWITVTLEWIKGLFKPRVRVKVSYRNERNQSEGRGRTSSQASSSLSQAELDAILDKISAGGYESLTKEEKDKLFHASKK